MKSGILWKTYLCVDIELFAGVFARLRSTRYHAGLTQCKGLPGDLSEPVQALKSELVSTGTLLIQRLARRECGVAAYVRVIHMLD